MTRQHRRSSRSPCTPTTTATTATTTATTSSAGLSFRCVMLVISLVLTPLLASRNVVADALASSSAAAAADHRRRCRPSSSSSSSSPPAFPGWCVAVAPVVDDRVGGVAVMASSVSEISSISDDRVDDDGCGGGGGGGGGPWWSRIRPGRIVSDDGGSNGDRRRRRMRVVDAAAAAAASTARQRGRPRWPRLSGPPRTTMGTKATLATASSSSGNAATTDADRPRSESRRRLLLPLSLMLLVPGRMQQQRGVRYDRGGTASVVAAASAIGAIEAESTASTTTRSSLAIGAALFSLPTAVGRLLQLGIGRVAGVGVRGGGSHHHHSRKIAGRAPPSVVSSSYSSSSSSLLASSSSSTAALSSRGGGSSSTTMVASTRSEQQQASYYVLETPLFPIILPGTVAERTAALEISVAVATTTTATAAVARGDAEVATTIALDDEPPSPRMILAVTRPLVSRELLTSSALSGTELYHPRSMKALSLTGLEMCSRRDNGYVRWAGERGADRFVEDHRRQSSSTTTATGGSGGGWYETLDASQEVLVWVGKFLTSKMESGVEYYGAELPIIKTVSVIRKSPKYLAELLMDSSRVKLYNKMSLGRTDVRVFQSGIDTVGGPFGDGESKVVRNLSRPPLVSGIIEFVTFMHARRMRPEDVCVLGGDDGGEGYIVVSRAVLGGGGGGGRGPSSSSSSDVDYIDGERLVRNEILLGVNVLRAVPGEPDMTELTSVTHVYSSMIPLMLAKSAGVKGATDFVRDIRALP